MVSCRAAPGGSEQGWPPALSCLSCKHATEVSHAHTKAHARESAQLGGLLLTAPRSPIHIQGPLGALVCADARPQVARSRVSRKRDRAVCVSAVWPLFIATAVIPPRCWEPSPCGRR